MGIRRKIALWICPSLGDELHALTVRVMNDAFTLSKAAAPKVMGKVHAPVVLTEKNALIKLAEQMSAHEGVTHFAISMRALGKGDFFKNLMKPNGDCRTRTASRLLQWFSDHWPADLEWPEGIPRPPKSE